MHIHLGLEVRASAAHADGVAFRLSALFQGGKRSLHQHCVVGRGSAGGQIGCTSNLVWKSALPLPMPMVSRSALVPCFREVNDPCTSIVLSGGVVPVVRSDAHPTWSGSPRFRCPCRWCRVPP